MCKSLNWTSRASVGNKNIIELTPAEEAPVEADIGDLPRPCKNGKEEQMRGQENHGGICNPCVDGRRVGFVIWASGATTTTKSLGWIFAVLGAIATGGFGWRCT